MRSSSLDYLSGSLRIWNQRFDRSAMPQYIVLSNAGLVVGSGASEHAVAY